MNFDPGAGGKVTTPKTCKNDHYRKGFSRIFEGYFIDGFFVGARKETETKKNGLKTATVK